MIDGPKVRPFGPDMPPFPITITGHSWRRSPPGSPRHSGIGLAQAFTARGKGFRTWKGLRVGQRSRSVLRRHPKAEFRKSAWWLKTAISPFGDNSEFPVVSAIVTKGRVSALSGWIGAAGDERGVFWKPGGDLPAGQHFVVFSEPGFRQRTRVFTCRLLPR